MNCAGEIEIFHDTTCAGRFCLDTFRPPLADDPLPPHTGSEFLPVRLLMPLPAGRSCVASVFASAKLLSGERAGRLGLTLAPSEPHRLPRFARILSYLASGGRFARLRLHSVHHRSAFPR
jgi:hypothetical protein